MTTFADITKVFSFDLQGNYCIEVLFSVKGYPKFQHCWMGKMPYKNDTQEDSYWFGLFSDGSGAYDYNSFNEFSSAPVFDGKSLKDIWECVEIIEIDGCDPAERIQFFLS